MPVAVQSVCTRMVGAAGRVGAIGLSLLLGACAQVGSLDNVIAESAARPNTDTVAAKPQGELPRAIEYWRKEHEKNPREVKPALAYVKNLKAGGQKERALEVLQQVAVYHQDNRELLSEYGRLALDLDQVTLAQKLLEMADDPAQPDWRVISARGTALAKQGSYSEAIPFFERALSIAPNQPSVLNNMAMALTADGQAPRAEAILKQAANAPQSDPKVRRNLALVLGLQGKHEDARQVAALDAAPTVANSDVDALRKLVKAEPQAAGTAPVMRVVGTPTPAATATPVLIQASTKAPVDADAAAEAIIQKAIVSEAAKAQKAKAGGKPALRQGRDDQIASQQPGARPVPAGDTGAAPTLALKPSTR